LIEVPMHEMSVAAALVEQLQRIAAEQHALRITEVEVQCGVMQQIVPEALQLAFEAASLDTPAAGAKLRIVEEGLTARCRGCGEQFQAAIDDYRCPRCKQADVELTSGRDILLRTVVCETRGEVA
jgi:hydrogenase nickel incorporation protein HypA/HybF